MKTKYEKDDVSSFRKYVREKRFHQPKYEAYIKALLERLETTDTLPIELILAKSEQRGASSPIDSVGVGKTDFTYFLANQIRTNHEKINVLAFPDIFDQIARGQKFYNSIFVPEILRLTRKFPDRLGDFLLSFWLIVRSFLVRILLLLRINILITVTTLAFIIASVSLDDIFSHQAELINLISHIATPIVLIILIIAWAFILWDKVKKDDKFLLEWKDNSIKNLQRSAHIENTNIEPKKLIERLRKSTCVIIIDDATQLDSQSLSSLIELVSLPKSESGRQTTKFGLVLICDIFQDGPQREDNSSVYEQLSDFRCRRNNWLCFDLFPPSIEEIEWCLWGFYEVDKPWENVKKLLEVQPAIQTNSGFLMQFIYDETTVLENNKGSLKDISFDDFLHDYQSFSSEYKLQAERILSRVPQENLGPAKEFIKYLLSFESPVRNAEIINMLMEEDGFSNIRNIANLLSEINIIRVVDGDYEFTKQSEKNTLMLNWSEWKENSPIYYSKVFVKIHDLSSHRKLIDNPFMAKKCSPSNLIVDTLWREGDALWFYGGNADARTAIEYYGFESGALAKWYQLFLENIKDNDISDENFYWHVKAKNSPYRYATNRVVRSESFIGDLLQVVAALYFSTGEFDKSIQILGELWNEINHTCWNAPDVTEKIKNRIREADTRIRLQLSEYLITGSIYKKDWDQARNVLKELGEDKISIDYEYSLNAMLWRINYIKENGVGNLPSSLSLIRQPVLEKPIRQKKIRAILPDLTISQIYLSFLHDCINYTFHTSEPNKDVSQLIDVFKSALSELERQIDLFEKQVDKALQNPTPLIESLPYPLADTETQILIHEGLCCFYRGVILFYEFGPDLNSKKIPYDVLELGKYIGNIQGLSERVWNAYNPAKVDVTCCSDVVDAKKVVDEWYSKFLRSENPNRQELQVICQKINEALIRFIRELELNYYTDALRLMKLASDLASIRLQKYNETQATYLKTLILIQMIFLDTQLGKKNNYIEQFADLINRVEIGAKNFINGYLVDSLRFHIRVAEAIGERGFESAYRQYEISSTICDKLENCLPSIVKGTIISNQLNLVGNMGHFVSPDHIFTLANQALEILNAYDGDGITKDDLEFHKASVRWWIAEACARLATEDIPGLSKYYENARHHMNWIDKQSKDNPQVKKVYLPKIKQVQSKFYSIQGDKIHAVNELRDALPEFAENLFEQIQTLEMIVNVGLDYVVRSKNKKESENYFGNLLTFQNRLLQARNLIEHGHRQDILYYQASDGAVSFARTVLFTSIRENAQLADSAFDLWLFGIKGYLSWGLAGRAAIQLVDLKRTCPVLISTRLPTEFGDLVRQCVVNWDPRRELTDKMAVERALGFLVGKNANIHDMVEPLNDKRASIIQAQMLLSRPTPETKEAYLILKNALSGVDVDNPASEDVDLLRLLLACAKDENLEQVKEYNQTFINISNSMASRIYLEIADAFADSPEIRDRYLHMAAMTSKNRYSDEANRRISHTLNKDGVRKADFSKDELEKTNYSRLMDLSVEKYDISEAYNLLFLFENELRRLIGYQFDQHNGWWKKGIPNDMYERVAKENGEHVKGNELLNCVTLGDLFKIILYTENWDSIFKLVFLSRNLVEARQAFILPVRNRIAHTDRGLSEDAIKEYVIATKNMIKQMQPHLPK